MFQHWKRHLANLDYKISGKCPNKIELLIKDPKSNHFSSDNRYSVVAFGGAAPFEDAHSIVYNNDIFTDSNHIRHHFEHIKTSNTNSSDISRAIKVASELVFRPGASKTFILMPCSNCNVTGMHVSCMQKKLEKTSLNNHIICSLHSSTTRRCYNF